ncbi:hypothetical protein H310_14319 [Aphanomyces invadans]|uniref:Uncharacterized protein n=1 Tax=Aphanomyces invadans TaxID=157072 RepID=A0A024TCD5_9STRA|nr:hypothetical protein H310_14319 [Aphanomyces invadans]ETV90982.1 hypothetical protein H310_14319 [Aphanomyces invadans]|eukprot:XP_008880371.1 hypothetical protein H310_14319 [Aphanomyces invadans]
MMQPSSHNMDKANVGADSASTTHGPATPSLKITAPSTPSLLAFAKFKEREAMGSPTSPGMSSMTLPARKELAEAAAFRASSFHDESSCPDDEDAGNDDDSDDSDMPHDCKANTGRWTDAEHKLFLKGLECFPYRAWKKIATLIKTRSVVQIRTHAQKYYQKLAKEEAKGKDRTNASSHVNNSGADNHFMHSTATASAYASPSIENASDNCTTTRQKNVSSVKKRKFSFDENHYTATSAASRFSKRKEGTLPPLGFASSVDTSQLDNNMLRPTVAASTAIEFDKSNGRTSASRHAAIVPATSSGTRRPAMAAFDVPTMILDYPTSVEDKHMDEFDIIDESLSRMTPVNDEDMLQLTDDDWFSSSSENDRDVANKMDDKCSPLSSPSHHMLKKQPSAFLFCDTNDTTTSFNLLEPETDPYSILFDHVDEPLASTTYADEFILDPQTFLTNYFSKEG